MGPDRHESGREIEMPVATDPALIEADARYQELVQKRGRLTWVLTIVMLLAFFSFILLIAFDKAVLTRSVFGGVTSVGIPVGLGLIVLAIALTAIYVRSASRIYDPLVRALAEDYGA